MKSDQIIDIMEHDAQLTEEQLQMLEHDAALREGCEDLFMVAHQMSIKTRKDVPDIEEELKAFHTRTDKQQQLQEPEKAEINPVRKARITSFSFLKYIVAAAAIFIGVVLIFKKEKTPEGLVISQDVSQQEIRIETKKGKVVPVKTILSKNQSDKKLVLDTPSDEEIYTISVPFGHSLEVTMPDNSVVFLHPGSTLEYPSSFSEEKREVHLTGQAYFIVTKDKEKPFIVRTDRSQTIVYGTEFDVTSFSGRDERITLIKGSVGVRSKEDRHPIQIIPGQQAQFCTDGVIRLSQVNVEPYISWRDGYFYFDNEELQDILISLGKYYNVSIECHHPELLNYHMRFIIPRNKDIYYVIEMINRMEKVHAEIQGNTIQINP